MKNLFVGLILLITVPSCSQELKRKEQTNWQNNTREWLHPFLDHEALPYWHWQLWQYYLSITTTNRTPRSTHGAVPVTNNPEKSIQTPSFFPSPLLPFELNLRDPKLGVAQIQN